MVTHTWRHNLLRLLWVGCAVASFFFLGVLTLVAWVAHTALWNRLVPLPGLDRKTSQLLRGYRLKQWKATEFGFADVVAFLTGGLVGMVGFAFLARNASDNTLSVFLFVGLGVGAVSGAVARRVARRRLAERRQEKDRQKASLDTRCRCLALGHLTGSNSRTYVQQHLQPEPGLPQGLRWQVRRCAFTGSQFLDFPAISTTVRVHGLVSDPLEPEPAVSPYL